MKRAVILILLLALSPTGGARLLAQAQGGAQAPAQPSAPLTPSTATPRAPLTPPVASPTAPLTPPANPRAPLGPTGDTPTSPAIPPTQPAIPPTQPAIPPAQPFFSPTHPAVPPSDPLVPRTQPAVPGTRQSVPPAQGGVALAPELRNFPPEFLQGGGLTNLPITALSPQQRQQINLLSQGLGQFRRIPATPALRQQLLNSMQVAPQTAPQVSEHSLARFANNMALAAQSLNLPPQEHMALSRNLSLLLNHGAVLPEQQTQALLTQTHLLLQRGGVHAFDLQIILNDLAALIGELQATAAVQTQIAAPGQQFRTDQIPGQSIPPNNTPADQFRGQRAPGQQIQLFQNPRQQRIPPQGVTVQPTQPGAVPAPNGEQ